MLDTLPDRFDTVAFLAPCERPPATGGGAGLAPGRYRAGMPQLGLTGLSEHWLLKECGDRHWRALAALDGRTLPRFHDLDGRLSYAAFTAIRVRGARLEAIDEHDGFEIATQCRAVRRAQHLGRHALRAGGATLAEVDLLSTFVRRKRPGDNRSVVRTECRTCPDAVPAPDAAAAAWLAEARAVRLGERTEPPAEDGAPDAACTLLPCPYGDFNGADFLYFASFAALADRAEWQTLGHAAGVPVTREREIYCHGNVNVGEPVRLRLRRRALPGGRTRTWCEFRRAADGTRLADLWTVRQAVPARPR